MTEARGGVAKPALMIGGAVAALLALLVGFHEARWAYWGAKVKEMCLQRGGVRIFRRIELPEDQYRQLLNGKNGPTLPEIGSARLGQVYAYSTVTEDIASGALEVRMHVTRVLRTLDRAVLSEQVGFSLGPGRLPMIIGRSLNLTCHTNRGELFARTFVKAR